MQHQHVAGYRHQPTQTALRPGKKPSLLLFTHQEKLGNANKADFGDFMSKTQRCSCARYSSMDQENNFSSSLVYCTKSLGHRDEITAQSGRDTSSNHGAGLCTHTVLPLSQEALVAGCPCVAPSMSGSATPGGPRSCVTTADLPAQIPSECNGHTWGILA